MQNPHHQVDHTDPSETYTLPVSHNIGAEPAPDTSINLKPVWMTSIPDPSWARCRRIGAVVHLRPGLPGRAMNAGSLCPAWTGIDGVPNRGRSQAGSKSGPALAMERAGRLLALGDGQGRQFRRQSAFRQPGLRGPVFGSAGIEDRATGLGLRSRNASQDRDTGRAPFDIVVICLTHICQSRSMNDRQGQLPAQQPVLLFLLFR